MRAFLEMRRSGATTFFEVGPGNVLTNLGKRVDREAKIIDVFDESQWDIVLAPAAPDERADGPRAEEKLTIS
jgi:malonyl CoA-acyl carrier protein transacylase